MIYHTKNITVVEVLCCPCYSHGEADLSSLCFIKTRKVAVSSSVVSSSYSDRDMMHCLCHPLTESCKNMRVLVGHGGRMKMIKFTLHRLHGEDGKTGWVL